MRLDSVPVDVNPGRNNIFYSYRNDATFNQYKSLKSRLSLSSFYIQLERKMELTENPLKIQNQVSFFALGNRAAQSIALNCKS